MTNSIVPTSMKQRPVNREQVLAYTLLFSTFFVSLRIGFEESIRLPTQVPFVLYLSYYLLCRRRLVSSIESYNYIIIVPAFLILQFTVSLLFQDNSFGRVSLDHFIWFFKYLSFYVMIAIVSAVVTRAELINAYLTIGYWSLPFVYLAYLIAFVFGIVVGADVWPNGWIRPHGFYSEPSNLCYYLPGLLLYSFMKRSKWVSVLALFTIVLVMSPTVYAVAIVSVVTYIFVRARRLYKYLVVTTTVGLLVVVLSFGENLYNFLDGGGGITTSVQRLLGGALKFSADAGSYSNARYDLTERWLEFVTSHKMILVTGLGFGVSNAYTDDFNDGITFDLSLWTMLINSFGLVGAVIVITAIFISFTKTGKDNAFFWIYYTIVVAAFVNPSGIFWQMLVILFLLTALKPNRSKCI